MLMGATLRSLVEHLVRPLLGSSALPFPGFIL